MGRLYPRSHPWHFLNDTTWRSDGREPQQTPPPTRFPYSAAAEPTCEEEDRADDPGEERCLRWFATHMATLAKDPTLGRAALRIGIIIADLESKGDYYPD